MAGTELLSGEILTATVGLMAGLNGKILFDWLKGKKKADDGDCTPREVCSERHDHLNETLRRIEKTQREDSVRIRKIEKVIVIDDPVVSFSLMRGEE